MNKLLVRNLMSELGKLGAKARYKKLSPERRTEIARKAGIASGISRKKQNADNTITTTKL